MENTFNNFVFGNREGTAEISLHHPDTKKIKGSFTTSTEV